MTEATPLQLDTHGFLKNPDDWNVAIASQRAQELGLSKLRAKHWELIEEARYQFLRYGSVPPPQHLCKARNSAPECVNQLFGGPLSLWMIAGLPDPGEEVRNYFYNEEC